MTPKKIIHKPKYIVSVSLDRESYMLWNRMQNGIRSQLVQRSIKSYFNKGLTPDEALVRQKEKIKMLQDERDRKIYSIEKQYESVLESEVLIYKTLVKAQSNETEAKLNELVNND